MNTTSITTETQTTKINTNPFSRAFSGLDQLFKYNQTMAIILLVFSLVSGIGQFANNLMSSGSSSTSNTTSLPSDINWAAAAVIIIPIALIVLLAGCVIATYVNGITNYVAWKTSRKQTTTFGEAIREVTNRFWTIFAVQILVFFRVFGGLLLFIVPGIRAGLRYQMVLFPVFDEGLNASHAIARIKELTKNHLIEIFGLMTAAGIIPIIGPLLQWGGEAVMYPELKQMHAEGLKPKVHWLNYIGLVIVGFIFLLVASVIALLAANHG